MNFIYYFATISLFLAFAYSVIQYIRRSNEDINEKYRLISFGIFLFVMFTDLKFLDTINKEFKYLIEFLLLSFSTYLFSLIYKNSDNKRTYYLFSFFTIYFLCQSGKLAWGSISSTATPSFSWTAPTISTAEW